ncbi:MAG: MOSC domain-containing protein [Janthinobacterium lividum]
MSQSGAPVGRIRALYRYPVKSTAGQALEMAAVTEKGLAGDRRWAAYTDDGGIASGKRTRRFRPVIGLMDWSSAIEDGDDVPVLVSREGARYRVDTSAASDALTADLGQRLTLRPESTIQHHDESPLHLLTTSSLAAIEGLLGVPIDQRRFRANIIIDTGDVPEFIEEDWIGAELAVGTKVTLDVGPGMPRCVMVDQSQNGVAADRKVLRSLGAHHGTELGVQARPTRIGTLRVGDFLSLRHAARS